MSARTADAVALPAPADADPPRAARRLAIFHDMNPETFGLLPVLRQVLGGGFLDHATGSIAAPEAAVVFANTLVADPLAHAAVYTRFALPIASAPPSLAARSLVPVAHPILRSLRRMELALRQAGTADPDSAEMHAAIIRKVNGEKPVYPSVNFHTGFLFGGATSVTPEAAVDLADSVSENLVMGLADFPTIIRAQMMGMLIEARAPLAASIMIAPTAETNALSRLKKWHGVLSKAVFQRLCHANHVDLLFFDRVATQACGRLPMPQQAREAAFETLAAMAELTQHRVRHTPTAGPDTAPPLLKPLLMEPDPVLGWRLRPGGSMETRFGGERVAMQADADGCRPVPGQPAKGEKTLAAFGCSCTYGWSVTAEQTFCAGLQRLLPSWRVENHGVENYGQVHNMLDLARIARWDAPDYVTFTWIPTHLLRNTADILWVQKQKGDPVPGRAQPRRMTPKAYLDASGELHIREAAFQRTDLGGLDLTDFATDPYQLDQVCFALMDRAAQCVAGYGGHFFVTVLRGRLSGRLAGLLHGAGIAVVDASVEGPAHLGADGSHPSVASHVHYARAIHAHITRQEAARAAAPH